jgi:hypothetical protein
MTDNGGVLENLPRSRPGKRSEKRAEAGSPVPGRSDKRSERRAAAGSGATETERAAGRPAEAAAEAAERAERAGTAAAEPAPGAKPRGGPRRTAQPGAKPRGRRPEAEAPPPTRSHPDPVGNVIRGAATAAGTGLRAAVAVAKAVFRRLPRP